MRRLLALAAALTVTLTLAACGDDDDDTAAETDDTTASTEAEETSTTEATEMTTEPADGATLAGSFTVGVATSDLGEILVDADGMTLYLFNNDSDGTSACVDSCAENWPPLLVDGEATAGEGADASLLTTIERADGSMQAAYNGHPLYRFAGDAAPGDTTGQGVGDVWWVVSPAGEALS